MNLWLKLKELHTLPGEVIRRGTPVDSRRKGYQAKEGGCKVYQALQDLFICILGESSKNLKEMYCFLHFGV